MFFKRFVIRKKLKRIQQRRQVDTAQLEVATLVEQSLFNLDTSLFKDYSRAKGSRIKFQTIHRNIEGLLIIIEDCRANIIERRSLPANSFNGGDYAIDVTLDRWLETHDRFPVKPEKAWQQLHDSLKLLYNDLKSLESDSVRENYKRKLKYVLVDSITSMEALLKAAL